MDGRAGRFPENGQAALVHRQGDPGRPVQRREAAVRRGAGGVAGCASKNADAVKDLLPTLRYLSDRSSTPWLGLQNYLAKGGSVRVLNTALGFRGESVSRIRPDLVGQAMEMMKDWSPQAIRGLEALERLNATARGKGRRYANLFLLRSEDPKGVAAALESLAILEPRSHEGPGLAHRRAQGARRALCQGHADAGREAAQRPDHRQARAARLCAEHTGAVGALRAAPLSAGSSPRLTSSSASRSRTR